MSIEDLMPLEEAIGLPKPKLYQIIRDLLPHTNYCANTFMIPEKMREWCTYLQCDGQKCTSDILELALAKPNVPQHGIADCKLNLSLDPILRYNGSCFDDYFCTPPWASKDYHYVLGILGLILALFSLISTAIYMGAFRREFGKKHTPALLLMSQSLCDILFIIIVFFGLISIYTSSFELSYQLKLYSSIHVYIIHYIMPFACFFESLSLWIIILLIFDRYNYLSHGSHSKNLLTKKLCFSFLFGIMLMLISMAILRIFQYNIVAFNSATGHNQLVFSVLGKNSTYNNLLLFWLKMPFESLFPLSIICIIIIMVIHKIVYSGSTNNLKSSFICIQEHILTKSVLLICVVLLSAKVPKLIFHILKYEIGIDETSSIIFELVCHLLDQIYLFIKSCIVYRYMCPIFTNWLQKKICIESGDIFDEYISNGRPMMDEYKALDYGFEKKCKKSIFIDPSFDKETDV